MTLPILLLLVILVIALILFSLDWVPADVTALGILLALIILGLVPLDQAFAGFGSDTVMLILGLLIMTAGLVRSGIVDAVGRRFLQVAYNRPGSLLLAVMVAVGTLSSFINNTAAAAFFLPIILGLGHRSGIRVQRFLMPMAFAAILASSVTLVATSTNVVVSGLMVQFGLPPLGMFELTPVGLPILIIGIIYMVTIGQRMIPERAAPQNLTEAFGLRPYLAELRILTGSVLIGKTLAQSGLGSVLDLTVLAIVRDGHRQLSPEADAVLAANDALLVEGSSETILKVKTINGLALQADVKFSDSDLQGNDSKLAEVVLLPRSIFIGQTIKTLKLREKYHIQVLAVHRTTGTVHSKIAETRLGMGDVLLVQGNQQQIAALQSENVFNILGLVESQRFDPQRALLMAAIFTAAVIAGATRLLPLPVAMLAGAFLTFVTGCITSEDAYRRVDWRMLILIGSMLSLGVAMQYTGTAQFLAERLAVLFENSNPLWLLTGFFVLTVFLTQPMSNQTAAAVVLPLAMQTAVQLGLNPRPFAVMIAIAASTSYLTPLEPACLMVYGPGRYRFIDFFKVGGILTAIIYALAIIMVPWLWPLT